jgi:hypothetical protein
MKPATRDHLIALTLLAALTVAMFADVLFTNQTFTPSAKDSDLVVQFVHWRRFGFEQLKQGNLALWNPHIFSGVPFFGGFQPALLYPLNFMFLILPLAKAISWNIALHVFMSGAFVYAWATSRQLHPLACFLSGVMYMFCGANFFHIYAGHLPHVCVMAWMPCLFLSIDKLSEKPSVAWTLLGAFVVAMIVLAGQPQYLFYAAIGAAFYCLLQITTASQRAKTLLAFTAMALGGAALSAIQLLTGIAEASEKSRGAGLPFEFASSFSFPPENLLTLLAPDFFGDMKEFAYWGRWRLWEMSLFLSVTGLTLAIYGAIWGERRQRRFSALMILVTLILALGAYTPLFKLLYQYVFGFDQFRSSSKFIFLTSLFLSLLAGVGLHHLMKQPRITVASIVGTLCVGGLCALLAFLIYRSASATVHEGWWASALNALGTTGESYHRANDFSDPQFVLRAGKQAAYALWLTTGTLLVLATIFFFVRLTRRAIVAIVLLATIELFVFARGARDRFDLSEVDSPGMRKFFADHPGDYRVLNKAAPNMAMSLTAYDSWGMDFATRRYGQAMAFTQGADPDNTVLEYLTITKNSALLKMVRCRFVFDWKDGELKMRELTGALPHLLLLSRWRVLTNRNEIFSTLTNSSFNPREEVLLESAPQPKPSPTNVVGTAKLVRSGTDFLDIEADVASDCLLLVTDAYSKGWMARPLSVSAQTHYEVTPADYCLRAVPLTAGRHHLRMEYQPIAFVIGKWISLISIACCLGIGAWQFVKSRKNLVP